MTRQATPLLSGPLARKELTCRPTRHGYLFLAILAAMLAGSVNYNNNAGFILVFLLGAMALVSLFHSLANLRGLRITIFDAKPVFKGDTARFQVRVTDGPGQGQALMLHFRGLAPDSFFAGESSTLTLAVPACQRGVLDPGPLLLASVFPLGLFRFSARISCQARGLVYPAPAPGPGPAARLFRGRSSTGSDQGDASGQTSSQNMGPDDFQGLAPYLPGHPIGHIAWKALSRGQGLFVKDFTAQAGQEVVFDLKQLGPGDLESRLSLICRAVLEADRAGIRYGVRLASAFYAPPGTGGAHRHCCLKYLALYGQGAGP